MWVIILVHKDGGAATGVDGFYSLVDKGGYAFANEDCITCNKTYITIGNKISAYVDCLSNTFGGGRLVWHK